MSARRALVIGLARSGSALARTLHGEGYQVTVVDRDDSPALRERAGALPSDVDVRLGGYAPDVARGYDLVSPSPGVAWDAPELDLARDAGIPVRSEIALVFERCRGRIVGITGTNGKTTTPSLVAAILQRAGRRVHLGGNIGVPMLDRLDHVQEDDWVVLELSSFQIETVDAPRCSVACVLNVTPDHLDRHGDFATYADIKRRVVRFATDAAVLGYDDPVTRDMAGSAQCPVRHFGLRLDGGDGTTVRGGEVVSVEGGAAVPVMRLSAIPLFGAHNVLNVLAATAVSRATGVAAPDIAAAVEGFHAVRHRLQTVAEHEGVLWVNDSKATNAESAVMALQAFATRPIVWIGGGKGAGTSSDALVDAVVKHARHAVLNGASAMELDAALAQRNYGARSVVPGLRDAVARAGEIAQPGDVVLLAPGFKSFDQFRDFEERGDAFIALVAEMTAPVEGRR
ncbi:MAG TPA: UDP-N-acetylmuramoyl-L-alanine--D-glutamate ligase [Candidatus Dormibacteraeota bacterium]|nr:UDP-N-acetylmuramoyl-L-alanine--D-glutamate ligase [Candidatus Dormibacteraeota bacterium]